MWISPFNSEYIYLRSETIDGCEVKMWLFTQVTNASQLFESLILNQDTEEIGFCYSHLTRCHISDIFFLCGDFIQK